MNIKNLIDKNLMILDSELTIKEDVIKSLINLLDENEILTSKEGFYNDVMSREKVSPTGLEEGLAIPHAKSNFVKTSKIAVARLKSPIKDWESVDENNKVSLIFLLAIPEKDQGDMYIEILKNLTISFMKEGFIDNLQKASTKEEFIELLSPKEIEDEKIEKKIEVQLDKKIVAVTSCPAGIAHTYMAAEGLLKAGKELNVKISVEKQGALGTEDLLDEKEIEGADIVILAVNRNIEMDRFVGKKLYQVKANEAIKDGKKLILDALENATIFGAKDSKVEKITLGKTENKAVGHIMAGLSYMVPMVIASGIILSIANIFAFQKNELGQIVNWGFDRSTNFGFLMAKMFEIGQIGFKLMIPLFAGFIANSMAGRPAIAAAMIGAYIANDATYLGTQTGGGFISAILVAFLSGYTVNLLKKIKWPKVIQPLLGIMIIPLVSVFLITMIVTFMIGKPIANLMDTLYTTLTYLNDNYTGMPIVIGAIIGAMIGFDFGGPVNKTALIFGAAVFTDTVAKYGIQGANFVPGTAAQAAISVAPLGIWLASRIFKNKFTKQEHISAASAFGMGIVGVTEGAIPFVASNPLQMITASVIGGAVAGGLAGATGCKFYGGIGSPIGTFIGYIEQPVPFITWIACTLAGIITTALIIGFWREKVIESENLEEILI
ncbi:PTS fructose transporter subunit IIABC [Candidatus Cetobacterium colombiensis]|uniref:Fructose-specific PTS transporter subunit EIIC n=1 Tax=Candidatus Cetobacterium colombiensis TaxID=3073100 RepID=A0ABU4W9B2_9FUSO|nr:fructose-specific PTS transporter subunit EIIC [Candidatus Cetobacterium colombiensis]MDX8336120.1 fructose-specific PTS transporter subunit EIIC [Candidatus Cetobacterium colombiensis]